MDIVQWTTNYMPNLMISGQNMDESWDLSDVVIVTSATGVITPIIVDTSIQLTSLNALPQSFIKLWLGQTKDVQIDPRQIIFSPNTARVVRSGDSKRFVWWDVSNVGIQGDELIFYNDPSWTNIVVVMKITRNKQSYLMQVPYGVWRDDKKYLNQLIEKITG